MTREEELCVKLHHFLQGLRPLHRVTLDLLRVAAVGRGPDEEISGADSLLLGNPDPGGVVSLALVVVQVEAGLLGLTDLQHQIVLKDRK